MSWVAVGSAAVTVVGGYLSKKQANKGNDAAAAGQMAGVDEQRRQYDQTRQDLMPWLSAGGDALSQMQRLNAGDFSSFKESPDYQWTLDQGMKGLDRSAAARGGLYSGGQQADLMKFGQGLASQQYGNYYNRLSNLANAGQTTGEQLGGFGANAANNIQQGLGNAGNARASSYYNNAGFIGGTANTLGGLYGQYMGSRGAQPGYTGNQYAPYLGSDQASLPGGGWQNAYGAGPYG